MIYLCLHHAVKLYLTTQYCYSPKDTTQPLKMIDSGTNLIQASNSDSQVEFVYIFSSEIASLSEVLLPISCPACVWD